MDKDSFQGPLLFHGRKKYRLIITAAKIKPEPNPIPNYWDENETEESIKRYKNE